MRRIHTTGALVVVSLVLASGCSVSSSDGSPARRGGKVSAHETLCRVLVPVIADAKPTGLGYEELLRAPHSRDVDGFIGGLLFARMSVEGDDLGPYRPALDYLYDRFFYENPEGKRPPKPRLTDAVERSARRIDRDLADRPCS